MEKALAILVSLLVLATPAIAAADQMEISPINPGITPDSFLYPLDKAVERIQLAITADEVGKAELRYKIAEERLAEAKEMYEKEEPELAEEMIKEYETELDETNNEMDKAVAIGKDVTKVTERVASRTSKHLEVLEIVYEKVPEQAKPAILHAIESSSKRTIEIVSHMEDGEEYKKRMKREIKIRGIDKGAIGSAVGDLVEVEDETEFEVSGNVKLSEEARATLDELITSFTGIVGKTELKLNVKKENGETNVEEETDGELTDEQRILWSALKEQATSLIEAAEGDDLELEVEIEHEFEIEVEETDGEELEDETEENEEKIMGEIIRGDGSRHKIQIDAIEIEDFR